MKNLILIIIAFLLILTQGKSQQATIETYSYDEAGRLVSVNYGDDSAIDYSYDPSGNLLKYEASRPASSIEEVVNNNFNLRSIPNPILGSSRILVELKKGEMVKLSLESLMGQHLSEIYTGKLQQGIHTFDFNSQGLPSGIYNCKLQSLGELVFLKLIVL